MLFLSLTKMFCFYKVCVKTCQWWSFVWQSGQWREEQCWGFSTCLSVNVRTGLHFQSYLKQVSSLKHVKGTWCSSRLERNLRSLGKHVQYEFQGYKCGGLGDHTHTVYSVVSMLFWTWSLHFSWTNIVMSSWSFSHCMVVSRTAIYLFVQISIISLLHIYCNWWKNAECSVPLS